MTRAPELEETEPVGVRIVALIGPEQRAADLRRDALEGLFAPAPSLPPNWFYDDLGSQLFEEITRLAEYYPTRAEAEILLAHASEIVALSEADTLVELGSGVSEKTRILLDEMRRQERLAHFVPLDVSEQTLRDAAREIHLQFDVPVTGVVGNFRSHLDALPRGGHRLICFLGGTVGNLDPAARAQFLADLRATMAAGDSLLLGTDLVKDPARLVAAYDDAAGVTAKFNKNVLEVLNRELGAEFDPRSFAHVALWNAPDSCIEMRLRSARAQSVRISALERTLHLTEGQEILTEISVKFTEQGVAEALAVADLTVEKSFTDAAGQFLLTLARPRS